MPKIHSYRTEGIVMRRSDFGEADRLLTIFTRDFGKVRAIAKGARKPQSRKTGHVELFTRANFLIANGRTFDIVTQAEAVENYEALRHDLVRTTYASYAVELMDQFTGEQDKNLSEYELLANALDWFAHSDNFLLAARYYELRLLGLVGFQPELFRCVVSQQPIEEEDQYFSAEMGGVIKPEYMRGGHRARPITAAAVKLLRYLQTRSWQTVQNLQLRRSLHSDLEEILHQYITFQLEKSLRSVDFLHRLRYEAALYDQNQESDDEPHTPSP